MKNTTGQLETKARANLRKLRALGDSDMAAIADRLERLMDGAVEGGHARARKLTKKRRTEIARNAANARWHK